MKILKIGNCRSQSIDQTLSEAFKNVTALDISYLGIHSPYKHSDSVNLQFDNLEKLNASHNDIVVIPNQLFYGMDYLFEVDLSHNKIISILSDSFEGADELKILDLSHNEITFIDSSTFQDLEQLQIVDFSYNRLETFDMGIFMYNDLLLLRIDNNRIKRFVYAFDYMPVFDTLIAFMANGNEIDNFTDIFLQCLGSALRVLNLSGNRILRLNATSFEGLKSLQSVNLSRTHLMHFDAGTFQNLSELESLDLSYNELDEVNFGTANFSNMEMLNLEGNHLNKLNNVSPKQFPKLARVGISKNRLTCGYATEFVQQWTSLDIIGEFCDQDGSNDTFSAPNVFSFIGIALIFVMIPSGWAFLRMRSVDGNTTENHYDNPVFVVQFHGETANVGPSIELRQPGAQMQPEEPIYCEIDEAVDQKPDQYDQLDFRARVSALLNHYQRILRRQPH